MNRRSIAGLVLALAAVVLAPVGLSASGFEWRHHAAPFDFLFDNHIDTHQQSQLTGTSRLVGFLYITPSGETTDAGLPIAMHGDCSQKPDGCTVGWRLHGVAREAQYCGHVSGEHPAWAISPGALPPQRGFTHFHWLDVSLHHDGLEPGNTYPGYLLKLTAVERFVFSHHGQFLVEPGIDFDTHANVYPTCADWPHFGQNGGGHGH